MTTHVINFLSELFKIVKIDTTNDLILPASSPRPSGKFQIWTYLDTVVNFRKADDNEDPVIQFFLLCLANLLCNLLRTFLHFLTHYHDDGQIDKGDSHFLVLKTR